MKKNTEAVIIWFICVMMALCILTMIGGCSAQQKTSMRGMFIQAAASYEIVQVGIEAAVTSGQLPDEQKALLQGIDQVAVEWLQRGYEALKTGDTEVLSYSQQVLSQATFQARAVLQQSQPQGPPVVQPMSSPSDFTRTPLVSPSGGSRWEPVQLR